MPAVAAPADRRFRRAHVKPARKGKVGALGHVWLIAKSALVLGMALYGGWRGTALVLGAPALREEIDFSRYHKGKHLYIELDHKAKAEAAWKAIGGPIPEW